MRFTLKKKKSNLNIVSSILIKKKFRQKGLYQYTSIKQYREISILT